LIRYRPFLIDYRLLVIDVRKKNNLKENPHETHNLIGNNPHKNRMLKQTPSRDAAGKNSNFVLFGWLLVG
jgi:hypothetical protein